MPVTSCNKRVILFALAFESKAYYKALIKALFTMIGHPLEGFDNVSQNRPSTVGYFLGRS